MLSFWEKESFVNYDVVVVGAGIVGLSAAISLKEKSTNLSVLILEKGIFPTGASTKNAGFACFGSLTEILSDLEKTGKEKTLQLVEKRVRGLSMLRRRLGDEQIDFKSYNGYELLFANNFYKADRIDEINRFLEPIFGNKLVFSLENQKAKAFGFNMEKVKGLVENHFEGQINTGKMMKSLIKYATHLGIEIITNIQVDEVNDDGNTVEIVTQKINFTAKKVVVCTNAFTKKMYPNLDVEPGRGHVLVTKPLKKLPFKGVYHMDEGFYYFRNYEDRIIFGGGRNQDFITETTSSFEINPRILSDLENKLSTIILPQTPYEIDDVWTGIMAFGKDKTPVIQSVSPNVLLGVRLNGMGVAIGSALGEELAALAHQDSN